MIDKLLEGAFELGNLIADKIAEKTGADAKVSREIAHEVAKEWAANVRREVTAARARAVKRIRGR